MCQVSCGKNHYILVTVNILLYCKSHNTPLQMLTLLLQAGPYGTIHVTPDDL